MLLERLHLPFEVQSPHTDETVLAGESPREVSLRLVLAMARAVAATRPAKFPGGLSLSTRRWQWFDSKTPSSRPT